MARIEIRQTDDEGAELLVEGEVDAELAAELRDRIRDLEAERVVLDFTHASALRDVVCASLVELLEESEGPVFLRGLRAHQLRVLHYLHVSVSDEGLLRPEEPAALLP
ncbi:MAG: hypothetical protein JST54_25755 [Deltaproteobacteria bacterium]|nr:hypothetical protein [Deltaproteobacteria bacterium]